MPKWPNFLGRLAIKLILTKLFNDGTVALRARQLIQQAAAGTLPIQAAA